MALWHTGLLRRRVSRVRWTVGAFIGIVVLAANIGGSAQGPGNAAGLRAGFYSSEQAKRGRGQYARHCLSCHQADLSGGDRTPPLVGDTFRATWGERTVLDFFERVRSTMPQDNPASLPRGVYLDIVAYLLEANDYPAGERDLEDNAEALKGMPLK